jgi:hypothetical protein
MLRWVRDLNGDQHLVSPIDPDYMEEAENYFVSQGRKWKKVEDLLAPDVVQYVMDKLKKDKEV